jgi:hypothetical protein
LQELGQVGTCESDIAVLSETRQAGLREGQIVVLSESRYAGQRTPQLTTHTSYALNKLERTLQFGTYGAFVATPHYHVHLFLANLAARLMVLEGGLSPDRWADAVLREPDQWVLQLRRIVVLCSLQGQPSQPVP